MGKERKILRVESDKKSERSYNSCVIPVITPRTRSMPTIKSPSTPILRCHANRLVLRK